MTHMQGSIALGMLRLSTRERFAPLFAVAARKSVFQWREAPPEQADVVVLDEAGTSATFARRVPCVLWIDAPLGRQRRSLAEWSAHLSGQHTVAELMDALDRASVFLMDWKAGHAMGEAAAPAVADAPRAAPEQGAATLYRLTNWVALPAPLNQGVYMRAMAVLTRAGVSRDKLCEHSGLEPAQADALLAELARRNVLSTAQPAAASVQAAPAPQRAAQAAYSSSNVGAGLVQKLGHWLRRARLA